MVLLIFFPKKIDLFNTIKQDAKIREMNYDTYYSKKILFLYSNI